MNDNKANDAASEAQLWQVRLQDSDLRRDGTLQADFERWLAASPENREAYEIASSVYSIAEASKRSDKYGSSMASQRLRPERSLWLQLGAVAAALAVLIFLMSGRGVNPSENGTSLATAMPFEPLVTQRGEIRIFTLSDGSIATLDTDSRIEVAMTRDARLLRLGRGRARLDIADDDRAFTVEAGAGAVVTKRAVIDIAYADSQSVSVKLIQGEAQLRPKSQYASLNYASHTLASGNLLSFGIDDFQVKARKTDTLNNDWPSGWVEYESIRLDALVVKANAYAAKPIVLEDSVIGALTVSGRFKINDTEGFVARICELFDLTATTGRDGTYIRKR